MVSLVGARVAAERQVAVRSIYHRARGAWHACSVCPIDSERLLTYLSPDGEGHRAPAVCRSVFDLYTATVGRSLSNGPRRVGCMVKVATLYGLLIAKRLL